MEGGGRHAEASKLEEGEGEREGREEGEGKGWEGKVALRMPTGVALSQLCEGSDGEEWRDGGKRGKGEEASEGEASGLAPQPQVSPPASDETPPRILFGGVSGGGKEGGRVELAGWVEVM